MRNASQKVDEGVVIVLKGKKDTHGGAKEELGISRILKHMILCKVGNSIYE